jgi:nucleoside-diphosphate-sugar epimerase
LQFSQLLGIEGFVHLAAPLGGILDLDLALNMGRSAGINALKACAKNPSVKRFVNTSSSTAASLAKPDVGHEIFMDASTYNDEACEQAKAEQGRTKGFLIYAAMKTETERAMWQWVKENKPGFVMNTIVRIPRPGLKVVMADIS